MKGRRDGWGAEKRNTHSREGRATMYRLYLARLARLLPDHFIYSTCTVHSLATRPKYLSRQDTRLVIIHILSNHRIEIETQYCGSDLQVTAENRSNSTYTTYNMNGPQSFSNSIPERNSSPSNNVRQDFVETRSLPSEIKMENEDGSQQWDTIPRSIVPSSGAQTSINMTITTSTLPNNPHQLDPHRPTINDSEVASHIGSHTPHQLKSHSSQHTPDHTRKRGASEGTVMKRRATPNLNGLETTSNPGTGSNGRGRESSSAGGDITKSKQASGNGNGNGNNAKSKKKKRRKGWKGYAVVDADGNIIESEEEEDESPLFQDRPLFETDDGTLSHRDGASATDEGTTGSQYKLQDGKGRDLPESDKVVEIDMPPTRRE